jgi:hypothetical protein
MGYGPVTPGGKQTPITPWEGSWAEHLSRQCSYCGAKGHLAKDCKWPVTQQPNK